MLIFFFKENIWKPSNTVLNHERKQMYFYIFSFTYKFKNSNFYNIRIKNQLAECSQGENTCDVDRDRLGSGRRCPGLNSLGLKLNYFCLKM